jgi:hypothetical protein
MNREETASGLATYYREKFAQDTGRTPAEYAGLWVSWDQSKRAYELRGEGLPAHPDLADAHPNGWCLIDYVKPTEARRLLAKTDRAHWIAWLQGYGIGKFYDAFMANAQGAESVCVHCGERIYLDIREGGGVPDWGSSFGDVATGLDYGCPNSPDTCDEGTGGHTPASKGGKLNARN